MVDIIIVIYYMDIIGVTTYYRIKTFLDIIVQTSHIFWHIIRNQKLLTMLLSRIVPSDFVKPLVRWLQTVMCQQ